MSCVELEAQELRLLRQDLENKVEDSLEVAESDDGAMGVCGGRAAVILHAHVHAEF